MEDQKSFILELLNQQEKRVERIEKERSQDMEGLENKNIKKTSNIRKNVFQNSK